MRFRSLIGAGRIATALAVAIGWLVVAAVVDRPLSVPVAHAPEDVHEFGVDRYSGLREYWDLLRQPGVAVSIRHRREWARGGTIAKVTPVLTGFTHTFPDDVGVLLVSPSGKKIKLMSDVGGNVDVTNVMLTFDDAGAAAA